MADCEGVCHPGRRNGAATGAGAGIDRRGVAQRIEPRSSPLRPLLAAAILLATLSACASGPSHHGAAPEVTAAQAREYAPPGPPEDPWGPYIHEASQRFDFSEQWIRAVMRQESGGQEYHNGQLTTSPSGAIGLMQVMPETYAALRDRYGLGPDPYYPRDNILAGTGYLRELYDRFGSPGFLAAYNAGPQRLSDHLATGRPLPSETVDYVAAIGPRIGSGSTVPGGSRSSYAVASSSASDALNRQALAAASGRASVYQPPTAYAVASSGDSDALNRQALAAASGRASVYQPPPAPVAAPAPKYVPTTPEPKYALASAAPVAAAPPAAGGDWGIQVGAFTNQALAQAAAENARAHAHGQLNLARTAMPITTRSDGVVLYRARLVGISADAASNVCNSLARDQVSCIVVTEDRV